jgi:hypothetical protein
MSKPTRSPFKGKSSASVTVLETKVHRSSARNARFAFIITAVVVGLLAAVILADRWHPIIAAILGVILGGACGAIAWVAVRIWPVVRVMWWWLPEITLTTGLIAGWTALARTTVLPVRLLVVAGLVGVTAGIPAVRRRLVAWAWCLIVRHRLRVCFAQFIIANQSGSLPLILLARPTTVGERVWIYLRPGLSHADLMTRLDKMAVTCHASSVLVERASDRTAGLLRIDVKRREVLTATVDSPLVELVDPIVPAPVAETAPAEVPTALDLPDVIGDQVTVRLPKQPAHTPNGKKPTPATPAGPAADSGDDLTDWI